MPLFSGQRKLLRAFNTLLIAGKIGAGLATGFGLFKIVESLYDQLKNKINQVGIPPNWKQKIDSEPVTEADIEEYDELKLNPFREFDIDSVAGQRFKIMGLRKRGELIKYILDDNPKQSDAYVTYLVDALIKEKGIDNIFKDQIFVNNLREIEKDLQEGVSRKKPQRRSKKK